MLSDSDIERSLEGCWAVPRERIELLACTSSGYSCERNKDQDLPLMRWTKAMRSFTAMRCPYILISGGHCGMLSAFVTNLPTS
jgi:hypothetical protein